jgi:small conductance mechanosensitive channel
VVLAILGVNLPALITGAGAIGLVFGLVAQSAFKDYIAGMYIILENQYRVGDVVLLAGKTSGIVEDITIRVTKLRDLDGNLHFVRNGDAGVITNMTSEWSRANVELHVGWDADLDKVKEIVNEVGTELAKDKDWREVITEPIQFYRVDGFTESSVIIRALGQTTPINQWNVAGEFRRRIKSAFEKHGIERPYPQRVVHELSAK